MAAYQQQHYHTNTSMAVPFPPPPVPPPDAPHLSPSYTPNRHMLECDNEVNHIMLNSLVVTPLRNTPSSVHGCLPAATFSHTSFFSSSPILAHQTPPTPFHPSSTCQTILLPTMPPTHPNSHTRTRLVRLPSSSHHGFKHT